MQMKLLRVLFVLPLLAGSVIVQAQGMGNTEPSAAQQFRDALGGG